MNRLSLFRILYFRCFSVAMFGASPDLHEVLIAAVSAGEAAELFVYSNGATVEIADLQPY
jgi:hypothetical protein